MYALSLDVSMTATGWAIVKLSENSNAFSLARCGVITTEKMSSGEKVSNTVDSLRRAALIQNELRDALEDFQEREAANIDLVIVEAMSWPRNAAAAIKMAMAWGAISTVIMNLQRPLIEVGPQEIKKVTAGGRSATKKEVEEGVKKVITLQSAQLLEQLVPKRALREHCWDALGAVLAAQRTEKWLLLQSGFRARASQ